MTDIPGSPTARSRGCTCPPPAEPGPPWVVNPDCPLHGYGAPKEDRKLKK